MIQQLYHNSYSNEKAPVAIMSSVTNTRVIHYDYTCTEQTVFCSQKREAWVINKRSHPWVNGRRGRTKWEHQWFWSSIAVVLPPHKLTNRGNAKALVSASEEHRWIHPITRNESNHSLCLCYEYYSCTSLPLANRRICMCKNVFWRYRTWLINMMIWSH